MLIKNSAFYLLSNVISAGLGFALVIVLTRILSPAEYGIWVVANSFGFILLSLMYTWIRQSILRFEAEGGGVDVRRTAFVGFLCTLTVLPLATAALVFWFKNPPATALATAAFATSLGLFDFGQEILRARQFAWKYTLAVIIRSTLSFVFALSVVKAGWGGFGLIAAVAAGHLVAALAVYRWVWAGPVAAFDPARLKEFVAFGLPITFAGIFYAINMGLDRLILASMLGPEAAGKYGAAADFVRQCVTYPAIAAATAIAPLAVHTFKNEGAAAANRHLAQGIELLLAVSLPAVVGLALIAPHMAALVFGEAYRATAIELIPVIAFAWLGHVIAQYYVHLSFNLAQKPSLFIWQGAATLLCNLALIYPLIAKFGIWGAGLSFAISELFGALVGWLLTGRAHPLPLPIGRIVRVVAAVGLMAVVTSALRKALALPDGAMVAVLVLGGALSYACAALAFDILSARVALQRFVQKKAAEKAASHAA